MKGRWFQFLKVAVTVTRGGRAFLRYSPFYAYLHLFFCFVTSVFDHLHRIISLDLLSHCSHPLPTARDCSLLHFSTTLYHTSHLVIKPNNNAGGERRAVRGGPCCGGAPTLFHSTYVDHGNKLQNHFPATTDPPKVPVTM